MFKMICITPVTHIPGLVQNMMDVIDTTVVEHCTKQQLMTLLREKSFDVIFTNPNMQQFIIDEEVLRETNVKLICTASTGLNHIDVEYCKQNCIHILSLTRDLETLKTITSTAEHAFCLMLAAVRKLVPANKSAKSGNWTWQPFLGRQVKDLTVGIVGHGRLGSMMAAYCHGFGAKIIIYDPYKSFKNQVQTKTLTELFEKCDVVSLHVHVTEETKHFINEKVLSVAKPGLILINTSRGEIVNEQDIIRELKSGRLAHYACDVIENEFTIDKQCDLFSMSDDLVTVTPHIGGSTIGAQQIAYTKSLSNLNDRLKKCRSLFGTTTFSPDYQARVGMDASTLLHNNSKELVEILEKQQIIDKKEKFSIFEIGSGPCRNLFYIHKQFPNVSLSCNDLWDKTLEHIDVTIKNIVSFQKIDTRTLFETQTLTDVDLVLCSDHLMHIPSNDAQFIIDKLMNSWKPRFIMFRECTREIANMMHPRLYHGVQYQQMRKQYKVRYDALSKSDPHYFVLLLERKD